MKSLLPYLKPYRKESILAPLFKLAEALMELLVPLIVAYIINQGIDAGKRPPVLIGFAALLAFALLGIVFSFTAQWYAARASVGFVTGLRQALFDHIQSLSYSELDRLDSDTLISRMTSDLNQVQTGLNLTFRLLLRSPFIVFGAMLMAFTVDVPSALIFVGVIPLLAIVVFGIMRLSIPLYKKAQGALDILLRRTRENMTGVRVIRAFRKESDEIRNFDSENESLTHMNLFVGRLAALMNPLTFILINAAAILLIRTGAIRVNLGHMRQGDVVALYNYMAQITVELIKLASLIITINKSLACAGRIESVFEIQNTMEYPAANESESDSTSESGTLDGTSSVFNTDVAISVDHVHFTYTDAGAEALTDIHFQLKKGETLGVIGGTGSGKSTLAHLLCRFYDPDKGEISAFGTPLKAFPDDPEHRLIRRIGFVPQKAQLFEGSIRSNLLWGDPSATDSILWDALTMAQAKEIVDGKDGKLDFNIEQNGRNLSGGQRQRLTIARALVRRPELLILDDASSALDFATDLRLRKAIHKLHGTMTVVLISQRTASVRTADHILVLDDGNQVGYGTHEELLKSCAIYREIHLSQNPEEAK